MCTGTLISPVHVCLKQSTIQCFLQLTNWRYVYDFDIECPFMFLSCTERTIYLILEYGHIYFITSTYTLQQLLSWKQLEDFNYFQCNYVRTSVEINTKTNKAWLVDQTIHNNYTNTLVYMYVLEYNIITILQFHIIIILLRIIIL